MQVELLYHTPDPERAIATAARLCYAPVGAAELMETMPPERVKSVLSTIMGSGHFSTLEHASYTFAVDGVSRALTHQLVRHRIASFNQQSQRYVKFTDGLATVKPESVAANEETNALLPWPRPTGRSSRPASPPRTRATFCPTPARRRSSSP